MKENYKKGFNDCMDMFENSIQNAIDNIMEDVSKKSFCQALDSIIATLYIAKFTSEECEPVEEQKAEEVNMEEVFINDVLDIIFNKTKRSDI